MVAKIVCGKSIRGVLNYNENKLRSAEASLLMAAGFPRDPDRLSFKNKLDRFEMLTRQNKDTRTNTLHIMLNFSRQDKLDDDMLKGIALDYMERIGFGNHPFLVYQHFDAAHPHLHIATVNVADGGQRLETHNIGKNQSEKARKELEIQYGLIKAEDQVQETAYLLQPVNLEKVIYGRVPTKAAISAIVREVVDTYKFTSLPEFNAALKQFNVRAYRGAEGTMMYEKGGLVYNVLNEQGEPVGIPIKASSIYGSPTLKNLEKRYTPNDTSRKPYGQRLKHLLDKAIGTSKDTAGLKAQLQKQGIRILFRENVQGNVYGVTFIDNATRVVFNGSDLGKAYGAKAFMERLSSGATTEKEQPEILLSGAIATPQPAAQKNYPAHDRPVIERMMDTLLSTKHGEYGSDPFRRKKKRRLQVE
ncbi:relaxase/mobilization nuclease domain-containing protein [Mucilaginibacter sp.]|uniref:relaxase/mobilization nuclease domain-containing protein n=1 Tax=Mucilaginibacter sp. TaxID=1882438 RepID=UPI00261424CE|nr:relaxase/mobilization nuclease domain-containing protein [Mucilaginibacter sp.]MDB5129800.1 hypothetical protein [Mucilaginibacter sp.]